MTQPLKNRHDLLVHLEIMWGIHCTVYFGVEGRSVQIGGDGEALDHPNLAQFNQSNRVSSKTEPNGLPKWHVKVVPTQALLKTFILSEDSPEVKGMFTNELVSSSVTKPLEIML